MRGCRPFALVSLAFLIACGGSKPDDDSERDATAPGVPGAVHASAGDRQASVTWSPPTNDGGSPITGYVVAITPGATSRTVAKSATSATFTGLTNGTAYQLSVSAVNAVGKGPAATSASVTPLGVPSAPRNAVAQAGDGSATVSWDAPTSNGGSPISGYAVTASPGGVSKSASSDATFVTLTGLSNGTAYTFDIVAENAVGDGAPVSTQPVTPVGPPDASMSSLSVNPTSAPADGTTFIALTLTVRDAAGAPLANQSVSFSSSEATDVLSAKTAVTGADGVATTQVTATKIGSRTFTATASGAVVTTPASFTRRVCAGMPLFEATSVAVGSNPEGITAGDFNGDGKPDLAVANYTEDDVSILLGNGDGSFQPTAPFASGSAPQDVIAADFDEDGNADLAVANSGGTSVLLGNGDGSFQDAVPVGTGAEDLLDADLDGDGHLDLATLGTEIFILLGDGDGAFPTTIENDVQVTRMVGADFDGDGNIDLALSLQSYGMVVVAPGSGDGSFDFTGLGFDAGPQPHALDAADFDGDGDLDLAVASISTGALSIFLGNGEGSFQAAPGAAGGSWPLSIDHADFNGDGVLDLAVTNHDAQTLSVLLGNGDGSFQTAVALATGSDSGDQSHGAG